MTVLDVIQKIASGEEVPHFTVDDIEYYVGSDGFIKNTDYDSSVAWTIDKEWLNKEVILITETKKEGSIKPLNLDYQLKSEQTDKIGILIDSVQKLLSLQQETELKINEIIKVINGVII